MVPVLLIISVTNFESSVTSVRISDALQAGENISGISVYSKLEYTFIK
jgi:hypothetical protein